MTAICHEMRAQAIAGLSSEEVALLKKLCGHIRENVARVIQNQQTPKNDGA